MENIQDIYNEANNDLSLTIDNINSWSLLVGHKLLNIIHEEGKEASTHLSEVLQKRRDYKCDDTSFANAFAVGFQSYLMDQFAIQVFSSGTSYQTYAAEVINTFNK